MIEQIGIIDNNFLHSLWTAGGAKGENNLRPLDAFRSLSNTYGQIVYTDVVHREILKSPFAAEFELWQKEIKKTSNTPDKIKMIEVALEDIDVKYKTDFADNFDRAKDGKGDYSIKYLLEELNVDGRYNDAVVLTNDKKFYNELSNKQYKVSHVFETLGDLENVDPAKLDKYIANIIENNGLDPIPEKYLKSHFDLQGDPSTETIKEHLKNTWADNGIIRFKPDGSGGDVRNIFDWEFGSKVNGIIKSVGVGVVAGVSVGLLVVGVDAKFHTVLAATYGENYTNTDTIHFIQNSNITVSEEFLISLAQGVATDVAP